MIKNRFTIFALLLILSTMSVIAQTKSNLTLNEVIPGGKNYRKYIPKYPNPLTSYQGNWCMMEKEQILLLSLRSEKKKNLVTLKEVNTILKNADLLEIKSLRSTHFELFDNQELLTLKTGKKTVYLDLEKGKIVFLRKQPQGVKNLDISPDKKKIAFTKANNLYLTTVEDPEIQITNQPEGVVCGQSVHRNEFGITKGIFWSPNSEWIAFYQMDERMVTDYPLVDISKRVGEEVKIKYPMAGMTSHKVRVGLYNLATGKTIYLKYGDPTNRYFTNIAWSPDASKIYLIELNRDQNHSQLKRFDVQTGKEEAVLIEERAKDYVEPLHPIFFVKNNPSQFIYQSMQDGHNHLYLYDTTGKMLRKLTSGSFEVQRVLGFDTKGRKLYFMSNEPSPLESHFYVVNLRTTKRTRLTNEPGVHYVQLNRDTKTAVDYYSSANVPRVVNIIETKKGKLKRNLITAKNPFAKVEMPSITLDSMLAADGKTQLYYRLVRPINFNPEKKYPAIIYVYGGPHAQLVHNSFHASARGWDLYMATKGYVVFTIDNRGSEGRGHAFEAATFRHLGIEEGKDQIKGAEFLQQLPYVDANRIGIHGWSFGGHMTTALMLRANDIFKVGVAGGPVIDWRYYEVMYGERYMDTPKQNPEGYKQCDLKNLAGQLKGKLMLIHDDMDHTCVLQHSLSFLKACVKAGTYPDFFIYPGHDHNVLGPERVHLYEKISRYFFDHL